MKKRNNFLIFYLKFSIIAGIVGLLYPFRVMLLLFPKPLYYLSWLIIIVGTILLWVYTIVSVYALFNFIKSKLNKITLVLPLIEIFTLILSILLFVVNIFNEVSLGLFNIVYDVLVGIFVIIFAIFLLKKFK